MSYLRSPRYIWSDGHNTHIWDWNQDPVYKAYLDNCDCDAGVSVPNDVWDALCLMRVAEIDASRNRRKYERKALKKYGGNFGAAALYKRVGITPGWEQPVDSGVDESGV